MSAQEVKQLFPETFKLIFERGRFYETYRFEDDPKDTEFREAVESFSGRL
jgi:hypothetical protein